MDSDIAYSSFDDTLDSTDISSFFTTDTADVSGTRPVSSLSTVPIASHVEPGGENPSASRKRKMISLDTGELDNDTVEEENRNPSAPGSPLVDNEAGASRSCTISECINAIHPRFTIPSQILKQCAEKKSTRIMVGQFISDYVLGSSGSLDQKKYEPQRSRKSGKQVRANKRQKPSGTGYHSLLLADEEKVLKVWCSYNSSSSAEQIKSVRRLAGIAEKKFVCIAIESGPLELRTTLEKYRKYVEATKEIKLQLVKTKILTFSDQPTFLPTFTPTQNDAVEVETWTEVDTLVESRDSFEINGTFAVVNVEGRHDPFISSNGVKYIRGSLQDRTDSVRKFTVWSQIDRFLKEIPDRVEDESEVVMFQRLRVKSLTHSSYGNAIRCPSITSNTSFKLKETSYTDFCRAPEEHVVSMEDLESKQTSSTASEAVESRNDIVRKSFLI